MAERGSPLGAVLILCGSGTCAKRMVLKIMFDKQKHLFYNNLK